MPLLEEILRMSLDQTQCRDNLSVTQTTDAEKSERMCSVWETDDHDTSCTVHMNVRRSVLARWEENPNLKLAVSQNGGHDAEE